MAGHSIIINWLPKDYKGNSQNWDIEQDSSGIMYFANNSGLLEYDGVRWQLHAFAEISFVRSMAIGADSNIYIGGKGEIGYFLPVDAIKKNSGQKNPFYRKYISLTKFLQPQDRDFTDVWKTFFVSGSVYFQTEKRLFRYTTSTTHNNLDSTCNHCLHVWSTDEHFGGLAIANGHVYTAIPSQGLMEIKGDSIVPVSGGDEIKGGISFMVPYHDLEGSEHILIGTEDNLLFIYDGKICRRLSGEVADYVKQHVNFDAATLKDGTIAIATQDGGVIRINPSTGGKIIQVINAASGLKSNNIYSIAADRQGALWITSNNGISRVELLSPITSYDESNGLSGSGYSLCRFKNQIYIATETGVFFLHETKLDNKIQQPVFDPVQGLAHWTWSLLPFPEANVLLTGTELGVYSISDHKATLIIPLDHDVICMHRSLMDSNRVFLGLRYGGIASIYYHHASNTWTNEGNIPGVHDYIYLIREDSNGSLWLTAKYNSYLIRMTFPASTGHYEGLPKPVIKLYDTTQGLPDELMIYTTVIAKQLYAYAMGSVFKYDPSNDNFVLDTSITNFNHESEFMECDKSGTIWFDCNNIICRAIPKKQGGYTIDSVSFLGIEPQQYFTMYADNDDDAVWFSGTNALIHYDRERKINTYADFPALIRNFSLIGTDSVIYDGLPLQGTNSRIILPYSKNSIRFEYAATSYDNPSANQFQYYLQGFDKGWSGWTTETKKDYTNLPEGSYRFHVRAKNIYKQVSREAIYDFEVLPPWWRTWWAYVLYVAAFLVTVGLIIRWRLAVIRNEKRLLEEKVMQRTEELKKEKEKVEATLSELKSTQTQLIQSEKMASLGELTAGIAHEIQNPLNFVNNFSEVNKELIEELKSERSKEKGERDDALETQLLNDIEQNLEKINHHGKRADGIVKGMLQHSRKSSGQKEPTDINALCDEYLRLSYHGLRAKDKSFNAKFETHFDPAIGKINVITQDMGRVMLNLINNALYACMERSRSADQSYEPTVVVSTKKENDKVVISVSDNGSGIPSAIKDKIFQPFFTTKPTGQGTGLGLSLSYDIVKAHGGEIEVKTAAGVGTEFIIKLFA